MKRQAFIILILLIILSGKNITGARNRNMIAYASEADNIKQDIAYEGEINNVKHNIEDNKVTNEYITDREKADEYITIDIADNEITDNEIIDEIKKYFEFEEINQYLEDADEKIDYEDMVKEFSKGNIENGADLFYALLKKHLFLEINLNKNAIKKIVILAFVTAIFSNFAAIFKSSQVSEMGFLICYATIITCLISSFSAITYISFRVISSITDFMKALIPVYAISVGVSDGQANAVSFYEMALLIIGMVDLAALKIILPAIDIYVGIGMINNLGHRDYLSKSCELIKTCVNFAVKGMLTVVLGLNVIQKMFSPVSGGIGRSAAKSMLNSISGISIAGNGIAELLYGTGKIIKSSIGGAGMVAICIIMAVPLIKIIIFIFSYYLTNAIIQPVSDERIIKCLTYVSDGASMVLKTVFSVMVMFIITITIICIS